MNSDELRTRNLTASQKLKVSIVQFAPVHRRPDLNREYILKILRDRHDELIIFPELSLTGYAFSNREELLDLAEDIENSEFVSKLTDISKGSNLAIVIGLAERVGEKLYNSALMCAPNLPPTTYRKVHLFYKERDVFEPGNEFKTFKVSLGHIEFVLGIMICFDWIFPESARTLALKGADIIAHPANLVLPYCPKVMPTRALENRVFTATANRIGQETLDTEQLNFIGSSLICSPRGEILGKLGRDEAILEVEIDLSEARDKMITSKNHLFRDRRPECYELS